MKPFVKFLNLGDGHIHGRKRGKSIREYLCTSSKVKKKNGTSVETNRKSVPNQANSKVWSDWQNYYKLYDIQNTIASKNSEFITHLDMLVRS